MTMSGEGYEELADQPADGECWCSYSSARHAPINMPPPCTCLASLPERLGLRGGSKIKQRAVRPI